MCAMAITERRAQKIHPGACCPLLLLFISGCATWNAILVRRVDPNLTLYERIEETMPNDRQFNNPFTDTELRLTVNAPADRPLGSSFTWYGFHDGDGSGGQRGNVWKFRLLFDRPGTWRVNAGFFVPGTSTANGPS